MCFGQAVVAKRTLAVANHFMQGRQIVALLDSALGTLQNAFHIKTRQGFQPQLFSLIDHLRIAKSRVILVVIINAKQREYLIDGINVFRRDSVTGFSIRTWLLRLPSWCR
jgi:hypothetical protein